MSGKKNKVYPELFPLKSNDINLKISILFHFNKAVIYSLITPK